ncbi:MAG: hypothetical protein J6K46_08240 [Sutterella sp.]|nr:hypothetical protein [Sutterella sp.]
MVATPDSDYAGLPTIGLLVLRKGYSTRFRRLPTQNSERPAKKIRQLAKVVAAALKAGKHDGVAAGFEKFFKRGEQIQETLFLRQTGAFPDGDF